MQAKLAHRSLGYAGGGGEFGVAKKTSEIAVICLDRFNGAAFLNFEIFEKFCFEGFEISHGGEASHNILTRTQGACVNMKTVLDYWHMLTKRKKEKVIKDSGVHEKDTGSPEVQIALLSKKIEELTSHLKKHLKDKHSRRGLLQMVADRRTHLKYLESNHKKRYGLIVKKLGLKK